MSPPPPLSPLAEEWKRLHWPQLPVPEAAKAMLSDNLSELLELPLLMCKYAGSRAHHPAYMLDRFMAAALLVERARSWVKGCKNGSHVIGQAVRQARWTISWLFNQTVEAQSKAQAAAAARLAAAAAPAAAAAAATPAAAGPAAAAAAAAGPVAAAAAAQARTAAPAATARPGTPPLDPPGLDADFPVEPAPDAVDMNAARVLDLGERLRTCLQQLLEAEADALGLMPSPNILRELAGKAGQPGRRVQAAARAAPAPAAGGTPPPPDAQPAAASGAEGVSKHDLAAVRCLQRQWNALARQLLDLEGGSQKLQRVLDHALPDPAGPEPAAMARVLAQADTAAAAPSTEQALFHALALARASLAVAAHRQDMPAVVRAQTELRRLHGAIASRRAYGSPAWAALQKAWHGHETNGEAHVASVVKHWAWKQAHVQRMQRSFDSRTTAPAPQEPAAPPAAAPPAAPESSARRQSPSAPAPSPAPTVPPAAAAAELNPAAATAEAGAPPAAAAAASPGAAAQAAAPAPAVEDADFGRGAAPACSAQGLALTRQSAERSQADMLYLAYCLIQRGDREQLYELLQDAEVAEGDSDLARLVGTARGVIDTHLVRADGCDQL